MEERYNGRKDVATSNSTTMTMNWISTTTYLKLHFILKGHLTYKLFPAVAFFGVLQKLQFKILENDHDNKEGAGGSGGSV